MTTKITMGKVLISPLTKKGESSTEEKGKKP